MKRISLASFLLLFAATVLQAQSPPPEGAVHRLPESVAAETISLNPDFWVHGEELLEDGKKIPLLIVLHGGGGTGMNIQKVKGAPLGPLRTLQKAGFKSLVVAPQAGRSPMEFGAKGGWVPADLNILLAYLLEVFPIDSNRVYLTGSSMGGYGTYAWAGVNPEHFAAIAPMVGGIGPGGPKDITTELELWGKNLATLPMRTYYGAKDRVVPADRGEMILKSIEKAGGRKAELIIFEDMGHDAGRRPYSDPKFFEWLFSHVREKG
jgi:predicted peptidase